MTQGTQKTDNRTDSRNGESLNRDSQNKLILSFNRLDGKAWITAVVRLSANNPLLVSVDLIGKKNQVLLEYITKTLN